MNNAEVKYMSIVAENGEQFVAGQRIIYNIEPNVNLLKSKDSYLIMDIQNASTNSERVGLNQFAGAHSLIKTLRIYSKETGVLLEQLDNYNQYVAVENQYIYDTTQGVNLKEGVGVPCYAKRNALDGNGDLVSSYQGLEAHKSENVGLSTLRTTGGAEGTPAYQVKRYCIPLRCGIFRWWDSEKLVPVLQMGGLRIEIELADNKEVLQVLTGNRTNANSYTGHDQVDLVGIGHTIRDEAGAVATIKIENTKLDSIGFAVGNQISIVGNINGVAGQTVDKTITAMATNGADVDITFVGALAGALANCLCRLKYDVNQVKYKLINTEFRLATVPMAKMNVSAGINYEFTTYDMFLDNIPADTLRHQIPVHSVASKAKCLMTMLYDTQKEFDPTIPNYYYGVQREDTPQTQFINELVYFINNRLYPLRAYNPQRTADRVLTLNEVQKAFASINKPVVSFGESEAGNLSDYVNTFVFARELARNDFVFDLRNAEPEIRLAFSTARPRVMRAHTFVFNKKIINTNAQGVNVIL